jgi:hypothetical protein
VCLASIDLRGYPPGLAIDIAPWSYGFPSHLAVSSTKACVHTPNE